MNAVYKHLDTSKWCGFLSGNLAGFQVGSGGYGLRVGHFPDPYLAGMCDIAVTHCKLTVKTRIKEVFGQKRMYGIQNTPGTSELRVQTWSAQACRWRVMDPWTCGFRFGFLGLGSGLTNLYPDPDPCPSLNCDCFSWNIFGSDGSIEIKLELAVRKENGQVWLWLGIIT
jgi:hypothetical protein